MSKERLIEEIRKIENVQVNYDGYYSSPLNIDIIKSAISFVNKYYLDKNLNDFNVMFCDESISLYSNSNTLATLVYVEYFITNNRYGFLRVIDCEFQDGGEDILI